MLCPLSGAACSVGRNSPTIFILRWRRSVFRPRHSSCVCVCVDTPQLANLQRRLQLPFGSLPLHLTKSIIVGLTMHLSLSVLAEFWAIAITFQRRIVLNPTELQSATFAGSWKVFELHFMILVYPDAIGIWLCDVIVLFVILLMFGSWTKLLTNFDSTPSSRAS